MTHKLDKGLQRLRVGQRVPTHRLVWIDAGKNPFDRYLALLAIEGVRDCVNGKEPIRHMPRRQFGAQSLPQPRLNITEFGVGGEYDEAEQHTFIAGTEFCSPPTGCCKLQYARSRKAELPKDPRLETPCSSYGARSRAWTRAGRLGPESFSE